LKANTKENEKLEREIDRLKKAAQRKKDWSNKAEASKYGEDVIDRGYIGHKSAKMMKSSKVIEARLQRAIEEKSSLLKNVDIPLTLRFTPLVFRKERVLEIRELSILYGNKEVIRDFNLAVHSGERVALCGKNGTGKSSILKLIAGEDIGTRERSTFQRI
jgi:lincosamide and streptogramin A transport system ATP-binding/permease protein